MVAASLLGTSESWIVQDITIASNYSGALAFKDKKGTPETLVLCSLPKQLNAIISLGKSQKNISP